MIKIKNGFLEVKEDYLFSEISKIIKKKNKNLNLINMSVGDIQLPLDKEIIKVLHESVEEMGDQDKFKGYSPEQGYIFLRETIRNKYLNLGIDIELTDIFVSDGSKSDLGNILDIFSSDNVVGIQSVCYPVYVDVCNFSGFNISYIKSSEDNNFLPMPKDILGKMPNLIYLCSPNNPTGMAYNKNHLTEWVNFALNNDIIIFYDSAYQDYIKEKEVSYSIYQIDGSKRCAIEFCSLSKSAGFTGLRCGYTIIPSEIKLKINERDIVINKLWARRQATKFNGVSYLSQRAADMFLKNKLTKYVDHCRKNSKKLRKYFDENGFKYWGGINSPYIWIKNPKGLTSKDYFEYLIDKYSVVTTPGDGFGRDGEGYIRISNFFI